MTAAGPGDRGAALQAVVDRYVAVTAAIPGLIVYVDAPALGPEWNGAGGRFDRTTGEPLRPTNTFRIGSNTKTFAAAATFRLVEGGVIGLDQPIAPLLPADYDALPRRGGYDPEAIRVRHLLTHTSGLYDHSTGCCCGGRSSERWRRWRRSRR